MYRLRKGKVLCIDSHTVIFGASRNPDGNVQGSTKMLENVQPKVVSTIVPLVSRIKVDPSLVVGRYTHLCRIAVIHIRSALIVFGSVIIVRIIHVGIVIEPLPILRIGSCPLLTVSLLSRSEIGQQEHAK